jgi:deoxyribodipyrimidine photolyase-related protein
MADADPATHRVLVIESLAKLRSKRWHRQRAHLVLAALRRFVGELRSEGFEVDHRVAPSFAAGVAAHRAAFGDPEIHAMAPMSWDGLAMLGALGVTVHRNDQFLCHPDDFAAWTAGRKRLKMEDFYRWQRQRLGVLMDGDAPVGGAWNFDHDNREPPPRDGRAWPEPVRDDLDDLDTQVLADLDAWGVDTWGDDPVGWWATSRAGVDRRLDHAIAEALPRFGPHEDAMLSTSWQMAHTLLSPYLNLGMLHPWEVVQAAEAAHRRGDVPIASAEGFIRQVLGWREYVWGLSWLWMPDYRHENVLGAHAPVPPAFLGAAPTRMRCVQVTVDGLRANGWNHHIQRLMVLGNLALTAGVDPWAMTEWMWASFVDGAEWVMLPNVIGMALHADGGRMATKPYASGGAYIDRMSDYCKGCAYDRTKRVGDDACPFTTLYWDFLDRHRDRFLRNARVAQQVRAADRLADLDAVRARAVVVRERLAAGEL